MTETYDTIYTTLEEIGDGLFDTAQRTFVVEGEKWIKHVHCNHARFHVFSYSGAGVHCSEPDCIVNKPKIEAKV